MRRFLVTVVVFFAGYIGVSFAQCNVTAAASPIQICAGDPVTLTATGGCGYLMLNHFNNFNLGLGWASNANPMFNNPCNPSCDGTPYLWIGPATTFPRQVTTINFTVGSGCQICFDMKYARQGVYSPCEGPDRPTEGVHLQYSTNNGASWTDINYWPPNGGYDPNRINWANYCEWVPPGAYGSNTRFRWYQNLTSGNGYDHWGLDNVEIKCPSSQVVQWSHGPTVLNPPTVYPTTTTTYTVTVSDPVNGNSATDQVVVYVNQGASPPNVNGATICEGQTATITATGSTGHYQWWTAQSGGTQLSTGSSFTTPALSSTTTYYVCAYNTSGSSCPSIRVPVDVIVSQPQVNAGTDQSICPGETSSLTATGTGTFQWSNGSSTPTISVSPLTTTTYVVTLTDGLGCTESDDVIVTVHPQPVANAGADQAICQGMSAALTASGGGTYQWSTGSTAMAVSVSPVQTATYDVTVTNSHGCTDSDEVVVTVNTNPQASAGQDEDICYGESITLNASGAPNIAWSTGAVGSSITVTPLSTTTFTVTVSDGNGCTDTDDVIVNVHPLPAANITIDDALCYGSHDGEASSNPGIGTPPYSYSWSNGGTSNSINGLSVGSYSLTITDSWGCTTDTTFNLAQPSILSYTVSSQNITCFSGNDGEIDLSVSGATSPYSYQWSPAVGTSNAVSSLTAGNYSVTITDQQGCDTVVDIVLTEPAQVIASINGTDTICQGQQSQLDASAIGGNGPYTYAWDNGLGTNSSATVSPTVTSTYIVTATDVNGCISPADTFVVFVHPPLSMSLSVSASPICEGEDTDIYAIIGGGTGGPYTFNWSNGLGNANPPVTVNPVIPVTYVLTVTDNCTTTPIVDSVVVDVFPAAIIQFIADPYDGCEPLSVSFSDLTSGAAIQSYEWDFGDPQSTTNLSSQQNPTHLYENAGTYDVSLNVITTDGCKYAETMPALINVYPNPMALFTADPQVAYMTDPNVSFLDQSLGAVSWLWDFGDYGSSSNSSTVPSPTHSYSGPGTFTVWLTVTSSEGCIDSSGMQMVVHQEFTYYVPSAFTPNGDGLNDYFMPFGTGYDGDNFEMYIYDRWGKEMFRTNSVNQPWDGRIAGSQDIAIQGVYNYVIILREDTGMKHKYTGIVTLVR